MSQDADKKRALYCYHSPSGRNKIRDWYCDLSPNEQAAADLFIGNVRKLKEWKMPDFRWLGNGLGELRWIAEKKQHRLIGFFRDDAFILLIGCTHKQKIYNPPDSLETAAKRKKDVENGKVGITDYDQLETDCETEES